MYTATVSPQGRFARVAPFAALLVTIVSVQFGAAFSKQLFPVIGVERATFVRLGLGAVLLAPILRPWNMRVPRQQWPLLLLYSAALGAMNLCFYLAVQRIPLGIAVALEFIGPLGLAISMSHRRMDLLWVALAIFGLALLLPVAQVFHRGARPLDGVGVMFALLAAGCWAAYSLLARRIGNSQGTGIIALGMAIAALLVLPAAALQGGAISITPHLAVAAVVMALFSSALPFSLEMIALTGMPIRVYGTFTSLEPALGTLMGLIVLSELPTTGQLIGIAAIVAASLGTALYTTSSH
jgi:inner membrane transporter RhtA